MSARRPRLRRPRDVRMLAVGFLAISIASLSYLVTLLPGRGVEATSARSGAAFAGLEEAGSEVAGRPAEETAPRETRVDPRLDPGGHARQARAAESAKLLAEGVAMIAAGRYDEAVGLIDRAGTLAPDNLEAYLQMGNALQGKGDPAAARFYFERAIDLDPGFADAHFGYAEASESLGDLESALGAMRSFLHLAKNPDPYRLQIARARSAIWEWEAQLGRGPWGPTRGIPPGFTAEEVRRDGRGVGVKMQKAGTAREDGTMEFEIKAGDRFPELFKP